MRLALPSVGRAADAGRVDGELDLGALGAALRRKKWKILAPTVLVALITLGVVQIITPRYLSEARVFIEGRDNIFLRPEADKQNFERGVVDQEAVTSQVQLILSRDLARDVIRQLKLGEQPEFDPVLRGVSPVKAVLGVLGLIKNPLRMTPEERVLESYYDRLSVFQVEKSRVIAIDFQSEDPELAARVANAIAEAYLGLQQSAKQAQARSAGQWLSGEIEQMRRRVADAENKVETFRSKSNLLMGSNNITLSAQGLSDFNTQLATARVQKADAESKARLIREMLRSGKPLESFDVLNSELIRRLSEQRVTLRAQLAEQSATLLGNHPRIKELRAQIADLDKQIRDEADTLARSLENDAKIASARVDLQTASLDALKNQAASTNEQDVQLRALERDAKSQRDLLESYLAKYREATARDTIDSVPADARVISRATVSNIPAFPKKLPSVLIATLATLVLSCGFVLSRELLGGAVYVVPARAAPAAAEDRTPATAASPRAAVSSASVPVGAIEDAAASLCETGPSGQGIAVVSVARGIATTLTAITLARSLGRSGRVVLVELGADSVEIRAISSDPSAPGLADLASGTASFGAIITKDRFSPVHLIARGGAIADGAAILAAPGIDMIFAALAHSYDHVVVHAGAVPDLPLGTMAQIAPRAILIADTASEQATIAAHDRLEAAGFIEVTVVVATPSGAAPRAAAA